MFRSLMKLIFILRFVRISTDKCPGRGLNETYPKDFRDILKRQALCIWEKEQNSDRRERSGYDEAEVKFPSNLSKQGHRSQLYLDLAYHIDHDTY